MSIYLLLKDKYGYTGGYSSVARYVASFKQEQKVKVTIRFETTPGYQAQVDWKEKLELVDSSNAPYMINIFLMTLGYSRMKFVKLTFDRTQSTLFECLTSAFEFFGGTTDEILFDNMKTVVDHAKSDFSNVVINEKFVQFAKDSGFLVRACLFFQLISKRYGKKSTIITTNMPFGAWGDVFNDNILASVILDRLLDQAYVVKIVGESYRTKYLAVNKKSAG